MTLPLNSRLSALYDTNGTQKDFSFGFRVFFDPDNGGYGLEVRRQTADGYEVIPKSDYLVLPVEDNSAGVVRFSVAPSAGQQIYIAGKTPTIQQLVLTNFGRYSAESIETQFDFITAIIQEWLSALGEETRQRIAADEILTQYVVQRIDAFVQQVNQNFDDKSQEIDDYIATIMPSFTQTLRDEIEAYAVAGMQDAIDQTLAESKAEIDDAVARANAAALAAAITGKVYDTPEAGVDPVTGVPDGAYFNVRSSTDDSYIDEYQNIGGVATPTGKSYLSAIGVQQQDKPASTIKDASGKDQQEINDSRIRTVESVADLLLITTPNDGNVAFVKSHYKATNFALAQPYKGCGYYIYVDSRKSENDAVLCINGWVLQVGDSLNLHQCGLKGDGSSDDQPALQRAVRVASANKLNLIGNPYDTYLLNSLSSESGQTCLIWCNTNYLDLNLNGAVIKVASGLGDYQSIFSAGWVHTKFKIYNGTIDQNTTNNIPQSSVIWSNTNGQRAIVSAYAVPHGYFEVSNIKMLDVLGVWQVNTTQAKGVVLCNNEIHYSSVPLSHTDKTAFYVLPRGYALINHNKFYGDIYGNATTAVEVHGSNCEFKHNMVIGFRSPLFIAPSSREDNEPVLQNIYVTDNDIKSCQEGILLWVESNADMSNPIKNVHISGNSILIDSRLVTNKDMGLLNGSGVGFLGSDEDCIIDGLYISDNKINYLYNPENIKKDSPAAINLTSFMPSTYFKWSNIYIQNNIVEDAPCNAIALGNKESGVHTSSIQNVVISANIVVNCGSAQMLNSFAVKIHNPRNLSKVKIFDNNFTETADAGVTWMRFVEVESGDGSEKAGVRFYDNETSFSRATSINEMYVVNDVLISDFRKNHLNHLDTNTTARYGSKFHDLNTGKTIVQSSLDANAPIWKEVVH